MYKSKISCIVLAAGAGRRMGLEHNKVYVSLGRKSVIQWTLEHVAGVPNLQEIILVVADSEQEVMKEHIQSMILPCPIQIVVGGEERQYSVVNGLAHVSPDCDIVLVHDGARPVADADSFTKVADGAKLYGAAVVAVPSTDTVKRVDATGVVI